MFLSLIADFNCVVDKSSSLQCGELVDISDLYSATASKEFIQKDCFTTCSAHRKSIENQTRVLKEYPSIEAFWRLASSQRKDKHSQNYTQTIRQGIPPQFRGELWRLMTGNESRPLHFMPYSDLFELGKQEEDVEHIMKAVSRTYATLSQPGFTDTMSRILIAYSIRNPKLGYCQSMNFLAATLLIFMEEESAFWTLVHVVEDLLPNYYIPTMSGFVADARVFEQLLSESLKELYKHFQAINLGTNILVAPWFLCMFTKDLPAETAFVVWDSFMLEGAVVLFEVGLAILRMLKRELLAFEDQMGKTGQTKGTWLAEIETKKRGRRITVAHFEHPIYGARIFYALYPLLHEENNLLTHEVTPTELAQLYQQYAAIEPSCSPKGLNFDHFSQFIAGTFSEWRAEHDISERLFNLADTNHDGFVDFCELTNILSIICRGTTQEVRDFCFKLFDTSSKGCIVTPDLHRMLHSLFVVFKCDSAFSKRVQWFIDNIFDHFGNGSCYEIPIDNFEYVVLQIPRILEQFKEKPAKVKYIPQSSLYHWLFENSRSHPEMIRISLDKQASMDDNHDSTIAELLRR